jgi:N-acyl-D-amino-acid deacylase
MLDYLITNARIIDPENGRDFCGSLGISGGKIDSIFQAFSSLPGAKETIDAQGGILVPGFVDIHAHSENSISCAEKLLAMGVTTAVSGNCGYSTANFKDFFSAYDKRGFPVNQIEQTGHGVLRNRTGLDDIRTPANARQINMMKKLASDDFSEGSCGLSFGLEYTPGSSAEEVLEVARAAADAGRFISIHGRYKYQDDLDSLDEALNIALVTGAPVIYSHLVYMYNGKALDGAIEIIKRYHNKNAPVWTDSGMYTSFATFAGAPCFDESIFLNDENEIKKLLAVSGKYTGKYLDRERYLEIRQYHPQDSLVYYTGSINDIFTAYSLEDVMVSTDCMEYPDGQGHPQGAATYPYFFRLLVKESGKLSMPDAVKRCTSLPARAACLDSKGTLRCGADADLVVLDWENLREHADFPGKGDPGAPPSGVRHVFVNGQLAIKDEKRVRGVFAGYNIKR